MHILELFTDPYCLCQEQTIALMRKVVGNFPGVEFRAVNALEHTHRLEKLGIKMFPSLLLDGEIIKVGVPDDNELKAMLRHRLLTIVPQNMENIGKQSSSTGYRNLYLEKKMPVNKSEGMSVL